MLLTVLLQMSKMTKKPVRNVKRIASGSSQKRKIVIREHLAYIRAKSQLNCSVVSVGHTVLKRMKSLDCTVGNEMIN